VGTEAGALALLSPSTEAVGHSGWRPDLHGRVQKWKKYPRRAPQKGVKERRDFSIWSGIGGFRKVLGIYFYFRDLTAQRSKKAHFWKGDFFGGPPSLFDKHGEKC